MKQGILLTLKELLKLGIIKPKRRQKRRSNVRSNIKSKSDINQPITSIPSTRYNEFISASQPPSQMAYTDNLRLRDEQSNFNTRLIEYKNQLENEKSLLENRQKAVEDDIDYSKRAVTNELQKLSNRINDTQNTAWIDDNSDVAATYGSDDFRPQTSAVNQTPAVNLEDIYPDRELYSSGKYGIFPNREGKYLSSRFSMPVEQSEQSIEDEDFISAVTELPPKKRGRGRPKSTIPLKDRRKAQYQKQKAKRATPQTIISL
jgi:hypothetical protein